MPSPDHAETRQACHSDCGGDECEVFWQHAGRWQLRRLTFELSGAQRHGARPRPQRMYTVPVAGAWRHAVGAPLERGVRPGSCQPAVVAILWIQLLCWLIWSVLGCVAGPGFWIPGSFWATTLAGRPRGFYWLFRQGGAGSSAAVLQNLFRESRQLIQTSSRGPAFKFSLLFHGLRFSCSLLAHKPFGLSASLPICHRRCHVLPST